MTDQSILTEIGHNMNKDLVKSVENSGWVSVLILIKENITSIRIILVKVQNSSN